MRELQSPLLSQQHGCPGVHFWFGTGGSCDVHTQCEQVEAAQQAAAQAAAVGVG
jgi:hypothetical protein